MDTLNKSIPEEYEIIKDDLKKGEIHPNYLELAFEKDKKGWSSTYYFVFRPKYDIYGNQKPEDYIFKVKAKSIGVYWSRDIHVCKIKNVKNKQQMGKVDSDELFYSIEGLKEHYRKQFEEFEEERNRHILREIERKKNSIKSHEECILSLNKDVEDLDNLAKCRGIL